MSSADQLSEKTVALRSGMRAEMLTIVWMIVEAIVAIGSGIAARSVLLTAFGIDSVIELLSGGVLLWRLRVESRGASTETAERRAGWMSAILLVLLCVYIVVSSSVGLLRHVEPEASRIGLAVAASAVLVMPLLAGWKRRINAVLGSAALRADIAETVACAYMAGFVVLGLLLTLHWWWAEYVASLGLLIWLVQETKEAFEAARGHVCDD